MSRITRRIAVVVAGAAAGFALSALSANAIANADTAIPVNPGLGGLFEQVVASSASIPQQLLQTASTLGAPASVATPAAPGQAPLATATLNMPQNLTGNTAQPGTIAHPTQPGTIAHPTQPGTQPAATGLAALPGDLGSMLPFPMPNLGLGAPAAVAPVTAPIVAPVAAPVAASPGAVLPVAPAAIPSPVLLPGLP